MVSANHIPRFLNEPYPQNKLMKQRNILYVDTNSNKLKVD